MPLTNSYATLEEFLALPEIDSLKASDDEFIRDTLTRSSREFDGDTGLWFYANTQTRTFDKPVGRSLNLDAPLLSVTRITNGNNTNVASTEYSLRPNNGPHYNEIRLKQTSTTVWEPSTDGDTEGVVTVLGTWGYVDRTATDPESAVVIHNTKLAVLMLALSLYRKRHGMGTEAVAQVTGAGVVITPRDKSPEYWSIVERYRRHL